MKIQMDVQEKKVLLTIGGVDIMCLDVYDALAEVMRYCNDKRVMEANK